MKLLIKMLKTDLHIHAKGDPKDLFLKHTPKQVIDLAAKYKFQVISFTFHNKIYYNKQIINYAKKKNILLIPGVEATIEECHILIYNITNKQLKKIKKIKDLKKLPKTSLIIAPHPYHIAVSALGKKLMENIDLFDAVEYSSHYMRVYNQNLKAEEIAKKHKKPMIGATDLHLIEDFNRTYSLINAKKNIKDVIQAIKKGRIKIKTRPISITKAIYSIIKIHFLKHLFNVRTKLNLS
jgi:predicted metal-dependent phosphoesterase TrpH